MKYYGLVGTLYILSAWHGLQAMEAKPFTPHYDDVMQLVELPPGNGVFAPQEPSPGYNTPPPPPTEMIAVAIEGKPAFTLHYFRPTEDKNADKNWDIEEVDEAAQLLNEHAQFFVITNKDFDEACLPASTISGAFSREELQEITEQVVAQCRLIPLYVPTNNEHDLVAFLQQVKRLCNRLGNPAIPLAIVGCSIKQDEQEVVLPLLSELLTEGAHVAFVRTGNNQDWMDKAMSLLKKQYYHVDLTPISPLVGLTSPSPDEQKAFQTLCHRRFCDANLPYNCNIAQAYNDNLDNKYYWRALWIIGAFWIAAIHITGQGLTITGAIAQEDANKLLGNCTSYSFENSTLPHCVEDPRFLAGLFVTLLGAMVGGPIITVVFFALPLEYAMKQYYRWRY